VWVCARSGSTTFGPQLTLSTHRSRSIQNG
jgi:hypothetical protein